MKVIAHQLPEEFEQLKILPLADLHIGDIHSDGQKIQEWIQMVRDEENCYCILNGDLMDAAIKSSIGDIYGASLQPMRQLEQAVKLFGDVKDKILAVLPGNHEARIYRSDGLDLTQIMCTQLGIGERYSNTSAYLFVRFGKGNGHDHNRQICYTIYAVHGAGGGRMEGGKVNRLMQLASICDADIYIHSHTHLPAVVKNSYYRMCLTNNSVAKVDRLFVNTSSTLNYGGYGEIQTYKPNSIETPVIILDGTKHLARAIL